MSEVYELSTDSSAVDLARLALYEPEIATVSSELLLVSHPSVVQALWRQKGRIDEDVEGYRATRDKLYSLCESHREDSRTRAGRKFEEIANVTGFQETLETSGKKGVVLDLCGAPGAFSIMLHKKYPRMKIVGFSLKAGIPWFEGLGENFRIFFGADGTGDIYQKENRKSLSSEILACPLIVADGGFEETSNLQELVMARLIFCETLTAMTCLSDEGNFLCKLFDVFSEFSRSLLFVLVKAFRRVAIVKPASSRPVNSERYVVCFGYRRCAQVIRHLERIVDTFDSDNIPVSLVPRDLVEGDREFVESLDVMTVDLAMRQTAALKKVLDERDKRKKKR